MKAFVSLGPSSLLHCIAGGLVCVVLPLASWWGRGRGALAFTMYSSTVTYRLEMAWVDGDGRSHSLDPTRVAENVPFDSVAPFLAGSEVFRTVPQIDALRAHLRDVARAACGERLAARAEIALDEISDSACALRGDLPSCAAARTLESVACDSSK